MSTLLESKKIQNLESSLFWLLETTFLKGFDVRKPNYEKELHYNLKYWFNSTIFKTQLDDLISKIIIESVQYADTQLSKITAAKFESKHVVLTEEAVKASVELSQNVAESIVRMLDKDAIYYESSIQLSNIIRDLWEGEKYKAESFARTFTADLATQTMVHRYQQFGQQYLQFHAEHDACESCRALNNTIFNINKDLSGNFYPPLHQHCRCALVPVSATDFKEELVLENRDLSQEFESQDKYNKAIKNLDIFNEKYRISKFIYDDDLLRKSSFEKS